MDDVVEEVLEDIDELLTFPGANAEAEPVPEPSVTKEAPQKENKTKADEEPTPEPFREIVDIIKNDNNVVVFFCK